MAGADEFRGRMSRRARQVGEGANRAKRLGALLVLQAVSLRTPVDTGRARANWLVDINGPASGTVGTPGLKPKTDAPSPIPAGRARIDEAQPGDAVHVTNNLEYIAALNDGHSAQAPAGFVQLAVADAAAELRARPPRFFED